MGMGEKTRSLRQKSVCFQGFQGKRESGKKFNMDGGGGWWRGEYPEKRFSIKLDRTLKAGLVGRKGRLEGKRKLLSARGSRRLFLEEKQAETTMER